jgi:hypothetical protein
MFLCALDGKLYSDDVIIHNIVLKQSDKYNNNPKTLECKVCSLCYGLLNTKCKLDTHGEFIIVPDTKTKIYKISSSTFENKFIEPEKDKPPSKIITDILKIMKADEKAKSKKVM